MLNYNLRFFKYRIKKLKFYLPIKIGSEFIEERGSNKKIEKLKIPSNLERKVIEYQGVARPCATMYKKSPTLVQESKPSQSGKWGLNEAKLDGAKFKLEPFPPL